MLLFVDYIATKHGMSEALIRSLRRLCHKNEDSNWDLVDRAVATGEIHIDIDPLDLLRAVGGVANINSGPWKVTAQRLVDIMIAGLGTRGKSM